MEAMNLLPEDYKINLLWVGNNMDNSKNLSILKGKSGEHKVHFLGYRTDVLNIIKASEAFVLSSIKGAATTKAVIEAVSL